MTVYDWWPARAVWSYLGLNMREGFPTHDINVRHGLSYAIDKELLTEEIMLGQAKRLCSIYPETSWAHNPDVPCYDYDPEKAIGNLPRLVTPSRMTKWSTKTGEQLKLKLLYGPNTSRGLS